MSRSCEICGAPIEDAAGACESCRVPHQALDAVLTTGRPRWGLINIELPVQRSDADLVTHTLRNLWTILEEGSFQKLAPTQLHLIAPGRRSIALVAPYSSFERIQGVLQSRLEMSFSDQSPAEIDGLLAGIPKPSA